jgi:hypothetical protein
MGVYDTIIDAPEHYDDQVKCWSNLGLREFRTGDLVPTVQGLTTYSVKLNTWQDQEVPRYVLVVDHRITNSGADMPLDGVPIFDKWGDIVRWPNSTDADAESRGYARCQADNVAWLRENHGDYLDVENPLGDAADAIANGDAVGAADE